MQKHVERILQGDEEAFRVLFESFYIPLCNFTSRYLGAGATAQDIAQETFVKYWQRREDFAGINQVRAFLYRTARNAALNEIKRNGVADRVFTEAETDRTFNELFYSDALIEEETGRLLRQAVDSLPLRTREVVDLSLRGLGNEDIAAVLEISRETVRSLKKIAHKKLRDQLKGHLHLLTFLNL